MTEEQWRPVRGYEGYYEVSDYGRVRSVDRPVRGVHESVRIIPGRELRTWVTRGYVHVDLWRENRARKALVHRLVLEAFIGPNPAGLVCCHSDDNGLNNHLSNLRWDTQSENVLDLVRHGTHHNARKTHCPNGHPYDEENTLFHPSTGRLCRLCGNERRRARRLTMRAAA